MHDPARMAALIGTFCDLPAGDLDAIDARLEPMTVRRGDALVCAGDEAGDALFIVVSGRFEVLPADGSERIAEIGAGSPIGEIAFFAGGPRTATVRALRDSLVLRLRRADFDELASDRPRLWRAASAALARRLATTATAKPRARMDKPRTIAVLHAGPAPSPGIVARLCEILQRRYGATIVDAARLRSLCGAANPAEEQSVHALNEIERGSAAVVYLAGDTLTAWSETAIRQADVVLAIARRGAGTDDVETNDLERYAAEIHAAGRIYLALVHPPGAGISATRAWLDKRPLVHLHHHLRHANEADLGRLCRYLLGNARGLVACGGGAFSAAHIGCFQAFRECGIEFDAAGGTSGGAAMTAALALGLSPDEIEERLHDIFVRRRSMKRWTLPRYSLLDPCELDRALEDGFSAMEIADLPIPYFALSTNLTRGMPHCHRRGPLWQAVRASSSLPALLPPRFTGEGEMLVDGCVVDNVPVAAMHMLKAGPNVVIDFRVPEAPVEGCAGAELPSRARLLRSVLSAGGRARLPSYPTPQSVLVRSLLLHGRCDTSELAPDDLLLAPEMPGGISHLDWHRHGELRQHAYRLAIAEIASRQREGHPAVTGT
jgi:NTE family protein